MLIRRCPAIPCVVALLLAVLLGAISFIPVSPARAADPAIPSYGAPSHLYGSPVGGGDGYLDTVDSSEARYVVRTGSQLKAALAAAISGDIVYVADGATITIDSSNWYGMLRGWGYGCYVKAGVTLAGGRGRAGVTGGVIKMSSSLYPQSDGECKAIFCETGADVCGLTLAGIQDGTSGGYNWAGIWAGVDSEIHNNEVHGFGYCGIMVYRNISGAWIHHNYIHHCQQEGNGSTVAVCGRDIYNTASAVIEGNVIDYARHFISGERGRSGYVFRYNQLGSHCTNVQIDCHGQNDEYPDYAGKDDGEYIYPAGEDIQVYNNTSMNTTQPLVGIRGIPYSSGFVSVHHNWSYHPSGYLWSHINQDGTRFLVGPIAQFMDALPGYRYSAPQGGPFVRMESHDNWWGTTAPPSANPQAPDLLYLPAGKATADTTPWLDWSDVDWFTTVHYQLQVDDDADFSSPVFSKTWLSSSSCTVSTSLPDSVYYWRARAVDADGNASAWTATWTFMIDTAVPPVPSLLTPVTGKVTSDSTPWLDWSTVTDATAVHYQLQVDDSADFSSPVVSKTWLNGSSWTLDMALPDGVYRWHVRAMDAAGNTSAWAGGWTFTVDTTAPPMPELAYPANGTVTSDSTPWLDWSAVTDATAVHYQLQVDDGAEFSAPVVNRTWLNGSSWSVDVALPDGVYYWRVRAVDAAGNTSAWTARRSFTIA